MPKVGILFISITPVHFIIPAQKIRMRKPWIRLFHLQLQLMCSQHDVYMWLIQHLELNCSFLNPFLPSPSLLIFLSLCIFMLIYMINMFTLWSITLCPCHQQLGLFLSGWCITDSRKGRKTKDECPRDKREEEEDCREDTERRNNISERHLLVSLLLLLILQRSDCGVDMNYTSNHVAFCWEVCEHFSGWLNLQ